MPTCNLASNAPEILYQIDVPAAQGYVGLMALVGSCSYLDRDNLDTTEYVIEVSDDSRAASSPEGGHSIIID